MYIYKSICFALYFRGLVRIPCLAAKAEMAVKLPRRRVVFGKNFATFFDPR